MTEEHHDQTSKMDLIVMGNWEALYRDPRDGGLWHLTYPMSYMQGGGPSKLELVSAGQAKAIFGEKFAAEMTND